MMQGGRQSELSHTVWRVVADFGECHPTSPDIREFLEASWSRTYFVCYQQNVVLRHASRLERQLPICIS